MFQPQFPNTIANWDRRLEIEDQRRNERRYEPYVNYLAPLPPYREERASIISRFLGLFKKREEDRCCYSPASTYGIQPG